MTTIRSGGDGRPPGSRQASPAPAIPMSGGMFVLAVLIGVGRALLNPSRGDMHAPAQPGSQGDTSARGREADAPSEIPASGWKDIVWRVYEGVLHDRLLLVAAGVTFYSLLALFPATAAIVSLYGLFTDASAINEHLRLVSGFLPEGALQIIGDQVSRIVANGQRTLGVTFAGTLALSLWGANAGTKSIFDALNIIYKEREKRGFVRLTLQSLAFTLGAIALALLALAGVVVVPLMLSLLGLPEKSTGRLLAMLRWPLLYLLLLFALACLYRYGPSRTQAQWRWVTWGSAIAGAVWIAGSLLLSWYVANFGTYNATYGSLGAVIGFLVWMWLSTILVLVGGQINAESEHQTARDTTGLRKARGARGARMADEIGRARP